MTPPTTDAPDPIDAALLDTQPPGLWVQGGGALGFPPPRSGYARGAYGNVTPDYGPHPWLVVKAVPDIGGVHREVQRCAALLVAEIQVPLSLPTEPRQMVSLLSHRRHAVRHQALHQPLTAAGGIGGHAFSRHDVTDIRY